MLMKMRQEVTRMHNQVRHYTHVLVNSGLSVPDAGRDREQSPARHVETEYVIYVLRVAGTAKIDCAIHVDTLIDVQHHDDHTPGR